MFANQLGWLHARPKLSENDTQPAANIEKYPHEKDPIKFPPTGDEYVVQAFYMCGMYSKTGDMSEQPLSWQEIKAFKDISGYPLTSWECCMIRKMSETYLKQKIMSTNTRYKEPWKGWVEVMKSEDFSQELYEEVIAARSGNFDAIFE